MTLDPLLLLGLFIGAIAGALIALAGTLAVAYYRDWRVSTANIREKVRGPTPKAIEALGGETDSPDTPQNGLSDYLEDARVICPIDGAQERVTGYYAEDGRIIIETQST